MKYNHILEVTAKEWFDRANGNSYFSAHVTLDDKLVAVLPYQYGYGDQYQYEALDAVKKLGLFKVDGESLWSFCDNNHIKKITYKVEGCKKRDMKSYGECSL